MGRKICGFYCRKPRLSGCFNRIVRQFYRLIWRSKFPGQASLGRGIKQYHADVYIFTLENGEVHLEAEGQLPYPRAYAANVSYKEGFVSAGGENETGVLKAVDYFYWQGDSLKRESLPSLPEPLTNGALAQVENQLYFFGGENEEKVSDTVWKLTPGDSAWTAYHTLSKPLSHTVILSKDKDIYILGGRRKRENDVSEIFSSCYRLDLTRNVLHEMADLPFPLAAGTGTIDENGKLWVFGGDDGSTFTPTEELLLEIEKEGDEERKKQLIAEKDSLQQHHPGFNPRIWTWEDDKWTERMKLPLAMPVTTSAVLFKDKIIMPNGEIRAGVRSPHILIGTWKTQ